MNVLYLSPGIMADYQCDMLFHGLRTMLGSSVVDYPRIQPMYVGVDKSRLYGQGFSLYGLLPDISINRANITERIRDREFDLIIYGSIHRYHGFLDLVISKYKRWEILFIDGEDQPHILGNMTKLGLYFKRELSAAISKVFPIQFAIPREKIGLYRKLPRIRVRALIDPRDRSTYIYTTEKDYYLDYAQSLFAFTTKKAGWDSLRHYEIMANGAIPLFLDLAQCPPTTCIHLPKPELLEALTLMDHDGKYWDTEEGHQVWISLHRRIHVKFACHLTTERLAQYVLETQSREAQVGLQRTA